MIETLHNPTDVDNSEVVCNVVHSVDATTPVIFFWEETGLALFYTWRPITANTIADLL